MKKLTRIEKERLLREALIEIAPLLEDVKEYELNPKEYEKNHDTFEVITKLQKSIEVFHILEKYEKLANDKFLFFNKKLIWEMLNDLGYQHLGHVLHKFILCGTKDATKNGIGKIITKLGIATILFAGASYFIQPYDINTWDWFFTVMCLTFGFSTLDSAFKKNL
ncbi:hypothetical protein AT258_21040 [Bacillus wiedmannii]|uniref:hypothetical protein n=1 Tax=Bacillus TaxID=1386 RepID=UPI00077A8471|nr:hypothetical protein [Bacillus mobilis]KXY79061.1 hypothetical protein AT258_21040 [Bacillus wiedmannii]